MERQEQTAIGGARAPGVVTVLALLVGGCTTGGSTRLCHSSPSEGYEMPMQESKLFARCEGMGGSGVLKERLFCWRHYLELCHEGGYASQYSMPIDPGHMEHASLMERRLTREYVDEKRGQWAAEKRRKVEEARRKKQQQDAEWRARANGKRERWGQLIPESCAAPAWPLSPQSCRYQWMRTKYGLTEGEIQQIFDCLLLEERSICRQLIPELFCKRGQRSYEFAMALMEDLRCSLPPPAAVTRHLTDASARIAETVQRHFGELPPENFLDAALREGRKGVEGDYRAVRWFESVYRNLLDRTAKPTALTRHCKGFDPRDHISVHRCGELPECRPNTPADKSSLRGAPAAQAICRKGSTLVLQVPEGTGRLAADWLDEQHRDVAVDTDPCGRPGLQRMKIPSARQALGWCPAIPPAAAAAEQQDQRRRIQAFLDSALKIFKQGLAGWCEAGPLETYRWLGLEDKRESCAVETCLRIVTHDKCDPAYRHDWGTYCQAAHKECTSKKSACLTQTQAEMTEVGREHCQGVKRPVRPRPKVQKKVPRKKTPPKKAIRKRRPRP